jgi:hypothetical protein
MGGKVETGPLTLFTPHDWSGRGEDTPPYPLGKRKELKDAWRSPLSQQREKTAEEETNGVRSPGFKCSLP